MTYSLLLCPVREERAGAEREVVEKEERENGGGKERRKDTHNK